MALGVTLGPATIESISTTAEGQIVTSVRPWLGVQIGGVALAGLGGRAGDVGLLFLAVELLLLHQAINLGKAGRLLALVPLFLLWANTDESFSFGLAILAASAAGLAFDKRRDPSRPPARSAWIALGLCFVATFVNPSHAFGVLAGFGAIFRSIGLNFGPPTVRSASIFSGDFMPTGLAGLAKTLRFYYFALVGLGLASFLLNRRDFSLPRFLAFAVASVLWGLAFNAFTMPFALVLAAVLALNGQEWYHRTFGVEGRLGAGWSAWSTGGRLVTIAVVFAAIARGVTGWGGQVGDAQFGFGFNPDDFPFESANAIKDAPIEWGILNTSLSQGDAIAWKAAPKRRAFVDSRPHLFPSPSSRSCASFAPTSATTTSPSGSRRWTAQDQRRDDPTDRQSAGHRAEHLCEAAEQPELGAVLRRRRRGDLRPGRRQGPGGRRGLFQGQPARRRRARLQAAQDRTPLGAPADGDVGSGRQHLPEPAAEPAAAPHLGGPPLAGADQRPARQALPARPRSLPDGDPRGQDRALAQARRLDRLPDPHRRLPATDGPGIGPDPRHPADAREHHQDRPGPRRRTASWPTAIASF